MPNESTPQPPCPRCRFRIGDRVKMHTALYGGPSPIVRGVVGPPGSMGCHLVTWDKTGAVTPLPSLNVFHDSVHDGSPPGATGPIVDGKGAR